MNSESSDDEVQDTKQRKLDVASTASLDLVALNNKVNMVKLDSSRYPELPKYP
jgi:hypothetical protein